MLRRVFLAIPQLLTGIQPMEKVPTDIKKLRAFVIQFNLYMESLKKGALDIERWHKVMEMWKELFDLETEPKLD